MQSRTGNVSDKLVIYNWGDYIDPDVIDMFEEETGIDVVYEEFETNEILLSEGKLRRNRI